MAFTVTARHSGNSGATSAQTLTTDSQTPTASSLLLVGFGAENDVHTTAHTRTISGGSLTYTSIVKDVADGAQGYTYAGDGSFAIGAALYRADISGSPSAFTILLDEYATASLGYYGAVACDITGHTSSTPVQSKSAGAAVTPASDTASASVTFDSAPTVGNLVVLFAYSSADSGGAYTAPTAGGQSMTQLFNQNNAGFSHAGMWYRVWDGSESSNTLTTSDLGQAVGSYVLIATEIAGSGGGGGGPVGDVARPWLLKPPGRLSPAAIPNPMWKPEAFVPPPPKFVALPIATETDTAQAITRYPFVSAVSSNSRYLVDATGKGIIPHFDTIWPMVQQGGNTARNGGSATYAQDVDFWTSNRASQGWNGLKFNLFGNVISGSGNNDGRTWDNNFPFGATSTGTSYADPSSGFASTYWSRVDYIIDSAAAVGLTCFIHVFYSDDVGTGGAMCTGSGGGAKALSEFQALGTFLGNRYKDKLNIVWVVGGDYFDTEITKIEGCRTTLRATGDTHLWTVQNWADAATHHWTTSRKSDGAVTQQLGTDIADINANYLYDQTYLASAASWAETPTIPAIWYDGYYEAGADTLALRRFAGWTMTYGAPGVQFGSEAAWAQPSGWRSVVSSPSTAVGDVIGMRQAISAKSRWGDVVPDLSSTFITAGRGTGNTFVTGGRTSDGMFAMLYIPSASSAVTIDTTQMSGSYTVTWVDPTNGATSAGTPGTSFSKSANAAGDADWLLFLEHSTVTSVSLPVATETDAAQALGKKESKANPLASETDTAQTIARVKIKALPVATETDSTVAFGKKETKALPISTETDATVALTRTHLRTLPISTETDAAQAFGKTEKKVLPIAGETDAAQTFQRTITVALPVATEAEVARAIGKIESKAVPVVTETDAAQALGRTSITSITPATETDAAQSFGKVEKKTLPISTETDATVAFAKTESKVLPIASETETAIALSGKRKTKVLPIAGETDSAVNIFRKGILPWALETDTAQAIGRIKRRLLPVATETDATVAFGKRKSRVLTIATESGVAQLLVRLKRRTVAIATEVSTAIGLTAKHSHVLPIATETDAAQDFGATGGGGTALPATHPSAFVIDNTHQAMMVTNTHGGISTMDYLRAGDTSPSFTCQLLDGSAPYNPTGASSIRVRIWQDGAILVDRAASGATANGIVTCDWLPGETDEPGPIKAVVTVTTGGKVTSFPPRGYLEAHISPLSPP